jgi:hypothetical protein
MQNLFIPSLLVRSLDWLPRHHMPSAKFVNKVVDMSSQIRYLALRERAHRPVRGESTAEIFEAILNRAPVAPVRLNPLATPLAVSRRRS